MKVALYPKDWVERALIESPGGAGRGQGTARGAGGARPGHGAERGQGTGRAAGRGAGRGQGAGLAPTAVATARTGQWGGGGA